MDGKRFQALRVRDWGDHYEISQTRRVAKRMRWVPVPTKHDGRGFRRLIRSENGPALFGAFVLAVEVAAKCPRRGVLADFEGPIDPDDLEAKTGCPAEIFERMIRKCLSEKIRWLETVEVSADANAKEMEVFEGKSDVSPTWLGVRSDASAQYRTLQDTTLQEKSDHLETSLTENHQERFLVSQLASRVAGEAKKLFSLAKYKKSDGRIFWQAAYGVASGALSQGVAYSAANAAGECATKNPPAYFRACLIDSIGVKGLQQIACAANAVLPANVDGPPDNFYSPASRGLADQWDAKERD